MQVKLQCSCGCGFITHDIGKAVDHAATKGHTITVQGTINGDKKKGDKQNVRQ